MVNKHLPTCMKQNGTVNLWGSESGVRSVSADPQKEPHTGNENDKRILRLRCSSGRA
jgi:hypothetical protein